MNIPFGGKLRRLLCWTIGRKDWHELGQRLGDIAGASGDREIVAVIRKVENGGRRWKVRVNCDDVDAEDGPVA